MTAWYEFEEIAGRYWHRWAVRAPSYRQYADAAVRLDGLRDVLAIYFRALGGAASITITAAASAASRHRLTWRQRLGLDAEPMELARIDGEHLVLPERLAYFPAPALNRDLYFWLAACAGHARTPPPGDDPLQADLYFLAAVRRTARRVCSRYPGLAGRYHRLCRALREARPRRRHLPPVERAVEAVIVHLLGGQRPAADSPAGEMLTAMGGDGGAIAQWRAPRDYHPPLPVPLWVRILDPAPGAGPAADAAEPEPGGDGAEAGGGKRAAERRALDQTERDDPLLLNPFEKMLSWSEMVNVNRAVEDDDVDNARQAADQLEQLTLTRHRRHAATRLKMELDLPAGAASGEALSEPLTYPEWHFRKRAWLPDHCAVHTPAAETADDDWQPDPDTRRRIRRVRRQFEALKSRRERLRARVDGDEFDMDALVRSRADQAAGGPGSEKVYTAWRDQARDLSVAILVDASLSTDSWIGDRRVVDVEREALLVLAHGIHACGDDQAVFAFTSHRRQRVEVRTLKAFDEGMDTNVERRIAALRPGMYTRMGAAIRHVAGQLAERPGRHRLLLVLSDGKPNDTDYYEGRYAVEDTKMAVREARRAGLTVFGVTIDERARQYLPVIFGRSGYAMVPRPAALVTALPAIYRQIAGP